MDVRARVASYYENVRALDAAGWAAQFADEPVIEDPVGGPSFSGDLEARTRFFRERVQSFFGSFEMREEAVFPCGREAAVKWRCQASTKAGGAAIFEGVTVFAFDENGRIATLKAYWDLPAMLAQLRASAT